MIESSGNGQIKNIVKLLKSRSERRKQGRYIVEGPKMVLEAAGLGIVDKVYIAESMWKALQESESAFLLCDNRDNNRLAGMGNGEALSLLTSGEYDIVADSVYNGMSDTVTPQGVMAVTVMREHDVADVFSRKNEAVVPCETGARKNDSNIHRERYIILENIQDPGNLGTILRTAEAAGYDAVIMTKGTVDVYNPKVVRSTMGAVLRVPYVYADNIVNIIEACRERGIATAGAALNGDDIRKVMFPQKMAIIIGNESNGISDEALAACDMLVKLPMYGKAESLNASVAAGVLMYLSIL